MRDSRRVTLGRVGPAPLDAGAPSEPDVPVSRHPAQASRSGSGGALRSARWGVGRPRVRSPRPWSWRLTCPLVGASSSSSPAGSPDRVSPLSRPGIRPVIPWPPAGELVITPRLPVAFRPPAFASRSSFARRGLGSPRGRLTEPARLGPRRGFHVPHARATTGVGALLDPGDDGAHPDRGDYRPGACRFAAASPCTPLLHSTRGASHNEASTRVHAIHPSGLPLTCGRPDGSGQPLGSTPGLRTPAARSWTTHAKVGTGHRARTWNYTLNSSSVDLQSGSSLVVCDLGSHVG